MYKNKKSFKQIKQDYTLFEIKNPIDTFKKELLDEEKFTNVLSELNSFVIKVRLEGMGKNIEGFTLYTLFNRNENVLEFYSYDSAKYEFKLDFVLTLEELNVNDFESQIIYSSNKKLNLLAKHYFVVFVNSVNYIIDVIINKNIKYKFTETKKNNNSNSNNNNINEKKSFSVLSKDKIVYLNINNISKNKLSNIRRNYNRKTESWYVLPHTRTYKSGKKVFIKGYYKGEKGKEVNKKYIIEE